MDVDSVEVLVVCVAGSCAAQEEKAKMPAIAAIAMMMDVIFV
jgi:hypothetical protein